MRGAQPGADMWPFLLKRSKAKKTLLRGRLRVDGDEKIGQDRSGSVGSRGEMQMSRRWGGGANGEEDGEQQGKMWGSEMVGGPWLSGSRKAKYKDPGGRKFKTSGGRRRRLVFCEWGERVGFLGFLCGLGFFFYISLIFKIAPPSVGNSYL